MFQKRLSATSRVGDQIVSDEKVGEPDQNVEKGSSASVGWCQQWAIETDVGSSASSAVFRCSTGQAGMHYC